MKQRGVLENRVWKEERRTRLRWLAFECASELDCAHTVTASRPQ